MPKVPWKRQKKGWVRESLRHSLAARGFETRGLGQGAVKRLLSEVEMQKQRRKRMKGQNKPLLRVMEQYLMWQRTRKGVGSLYSFDDIRITHNQIVKSRDDRSIDKANQLWDEIRAYDKSGFIPKRQFTRLERAAIRARDKQLTGTSLTALEKRGLRRESPLPVKPKPKLRLRIPSLPKSQEIPALDLPKSPRLTLR